MSSYIRDVRVLMREWIPMRDGARLAATVYLPAQAGRYPAVLVRTPYNRFSYSGAGWTKHEVAFVVQDCRGRYESEGEWAPFQHETADGLDSLDWIGRQPWSNGRVGMYGDSYLAATQFALAAEGHPALHALSPRFMCGDMWRQGYYSNGAFSLALSFSWLCLEAGGRLSTSGLLPHFDVEKLLRELPLQTLDEKAGCGVIPAYRKFVERTADERLKESQAWRARLHRASAPMLLVGGWYDYYPGETFRNYAALLGQGTAPVPDPQLAASHRIVIGPWSHGAGSTSQLGELDFGTDALEESASPVRWLTSLLKGRSPEEFQKAPIRIFVMGANRWRDEWEWPLRRTRFTPFYLHSNGQANSTRGDGVLSSLAPRSQPPDRYRYDPQNPVSTRGGNHSIGPYNPGLYELALPGPYDQRATEERDDVLVYTSQPLEEDMEVTGPIELRLYASSSTPDTDWIARLCDVYPDGRSINITEGVLRARYRKGFWDEPAFLTPDQVYEYSIELQPTSNVFRKGHRIRLQITSSNFPLWDRNLNTGEDTATGTRWSIALQTVFHDANHPSHLMLPIIPSREATSTPGRAD